MRLRAAQFPKDFARFATLGVACTLAASVAGAQSTAVRRPTTLRQTPTATLADTAMRVRGTATADARFTMPYRWLTVDSTGTERVLIPYFVLVGGGLTHDVSSRQYRGTALVGVEDTLHPNEGPIQLARALRLQLTTMSGGTVTPAQLAIAHTSLDYDSVRIEAADSTHGVAAASAIGLDLMHLRIDDPGTWIAVMITAALGAWAGARVIEKAVAAPATS